MPLPIIAVGAAGATFLGTLTAFIDQLADGVAYVTGERDPTLDEIQGWMRGYEGPLARWAVGAVFESMGLDLDTSEGITGPAITRAVNAGPLEGTGIELTNLFDRQAVIEDLTRWGVAKACESLGISGETITDIRAALREQLAGEITQQLASEAGDLIEAAPDAARVVRIMAAVPPGSGWNEPRDFSPAGISNRERQARFRQTSRKHWEPR